jgi:hypothetical protein
MYNFLANSTGVGKNGGGLSPQFQLQQANFISQMLQNRMKQHNNGANNQMITPPSPSQQIAVGQQPQQTMQHQLSFGGGLSINP